MEVNIQYLDIHLRKILAKECKRLYAMNKLNFQFLEGVHMHNALQKFENNQNNSASNQGDLRIPIVYAALLRISTGERPFLSEIRSKL